MKDDFHKVVKHRYYVSRNISRPLSIGEKYEILL